MLDFRPAIFGMLAAVIAGGCGPAAPREAAAPGEGETRAGRTLVFVGQVEPATLSTKVLLTTGGLAIGATTRLFNASLSSEDGSGVPQPYLAESLPQLNTDTWRMAPDGTMETTYRLRPGLIWHDGAPLTADDFVFTWRVLTAPEMGEPSRPPHGLMAEATAPEPRTLVVRWTRTYRDAGSLGLQPFPRHLLEESFRSQIDAFASLGYWTTEYVGAGPFRLDRWEPGAFIEASAFAGHALGRPKIDRIRILFAPDANTALAHMLAGEAHATLDDALRFQQGLILKREWAPRNGGHVLGIPDQWRRNEVQHRPEYAQPRAILDVRVRKALAHTIDKQAVNDVNFEGEGIMADSPIPPMVDYFSVVDRAMVKYPFDPRRAAQLMEEGGFVKGQDGFYASPTEGPLVWEIKTNASAQSETEVALLADQWRKVGFAFRAAVNPPALSRDAQVRAVFPTLFGGGGPVGDDALARFTTDQTPGPENRWTGSNRGGFSHPDFDRLTEAFDVTVDRTERGRVVAEMARVFTDSVGAISLYFNPGILAHVSELHGPQAASPGASRTWNVHEWQWR